MGGATLLPRTPLDIGLVAAPLARGARAAQVIFAREGLLGAEALAPLGKIEVKPNVMFGGKDGSSPSLDSTFTNKVSITESGRLYGAHKDLVRERAKDSHHVIQDAAVRDIPGYNRANAPAIQLKGPASRKGTEHYHATQEQSKPGGGTFGNERIRAYRAMRKGGVAKNEAKEQIKKADEYFSGIGVKKETPTRVPGNRKGKNDDK